MLENVQLAFQGIMGHKMRSILTMLGIIIGIAAIMTIVSTIEGTNEQIKRNLIGAGTDAVKIELFQGDSPVDFSYGEILEEIPVITDKEIKKIEALEEVSKVALYNSRNYAENVYYKSTSFSGMIKGVDQNYLDIYNYYVQFGRFFEERDFENFNKVLLLDSVASKSIFNGENPIGKVIEIQNEPFTVIGVIEKSSKFKPVINSISDYNTYMEEANGELFIPIASWSIIYQYDEPQNLVVKTVSTDDMTKAGKKAAEILSSRIKTSEGEEGQLTYKNDDLLKQAKQLQELGASSNTQLILIASISLIVGGIGVMNIMLVSVTERTKEIGLKKAIGAKRKRILWQFLTEAAVLTSIGGILGVISGFVVSKILSKVSMIPVAVNIPATIISVVFSMAIGIVFGLIPAMKASKLSPIEALKSE